MNTENRVLLGFCLLGYLLLRTTFTPGQVFPLFILQHVPTINRIPKSHISLTTESLLMIEKTEQQKWSKTTTLGTNIAFHETFGTCNYLYLLSSQPQSNGKTAFVTQYYFWLII